MTKLRVELLNFCACWVFLCIYWLQHLGLLDVVFCADLSTKKCKLESPNNFCVGTLLVCYWSLMLTSNFG